jgi:hypothetical protein
MIWRRFVPPIAEDLNAIYFSLSFFFQLDESRIRLEQGLDPATGHPSLRAHAEIQRAELDAWLADLGEFACQCWAFAAEEEATDGNKHRKAAAKEGGLAEEEAEEDSDDEEDEEEEEADDNDDLLGPSTSKQQRPVGAGKNGLTAGAVRSDTARIRLACEFLIIMGRK